MTSASVRERFAVAAQEYPIPAKAAFRTLKVPRTLERKGTGKRRPSDLQVSRPPGRTESRARPRSIDLSTDAEVVAK
jgi:hypothetical protein